MKKDFMLIGGLAVLIVALMFFGRSYGLVPGLSTKSQFLTTTEVKIKGNVYRVDIARNTNEQAKGLSGKETLAQNTGMLFVFSKPEKYQFWMKNTKIPLDIIWLDGNKKIVDYYKEAQPQPQASDQQLRLYGPSTSALYVLEVAGGTIDRDKIEIGDTAEFRLE